MNVSMNCRGEIIRKSDVDFVEFTRNPIDHRFRITVNFKSGKTANYGIGWFHSIVIYGDGTTTRPHEINNQ